MQKFALTLVLTVLTGATLAFLPQSSAGFSKTDTAKIKVDTVQYCWSVHRDNNILRDSTGAITGMIELKVTTRIPCATQRRS